MAFIEFEKKRKEKKQKKETPYEIKKDTREEK